MECRRIKLVEETNEKYKEAEGCGLKVGYLQNYTTLQYQPETHSDVAEVAF